MILEDDTQVYLAQGAIVYGGFRGSPKNARIYGRGILDGSRLKERMVHFTGASNLVVEGIIMRGGNGWQNTLQNCDRITYRNVKVLSFGPSGDGINPVNSRDVLIEDCFFRCSDDCIAIKAPGKGANVSGITIQNCIMAGYGLSDGVTVGYELVADAVENIIVRDCDILCARGGTRAGRHSAFSIICDGSATVRNVLFENIRVEENVPQLFELNVTHAQHYTRTSPGRIQNVRLRNIRWQTALPILLLGQDDEHRVEDVLFENCLVAGQSLTMEHLRTNAFTRAIRVQP
jgi:polygalacturonase